jgi:RNA-directed DNA polymerase
MNTDVSIPMDRWNTLPWKSIQRNVFKLQTRIYRAACRDDVYIDIVTIRKQPERLVAKVRMTRATLLRSRMNGNVHVRFCSRVGVATSRLRQR